MTDLQPFEVSVKSKINTMVTQDGHQRGMSLSKALCVDNDVTDQVQTLNVTDCRKSFSVEVKDKVRLEKDKGCAEFKSLNNFFIERDESLEAEKTCLEGIEGLGLLHSGVDAPLETGSDKESLNGISDEMAHKRNYNTHVSESKPFKQQFRLLPTDLENATEKEVTSHDQTKAGLDSFLDLKGKLDHCKKHGLQDSGNVMLDDKNRKMKETLSDESEYSTVPFPCHQQAREAAQQPEATGACAAVISPPCPSAVSGDNSKGLKNSPNSINTLPTLVKTDSSPAEITMRKNMNNIQNSPFKNHLGSSESNMSISNIPVNQGDSHASQARDLKFVAPMITSTGKPLSSENQITEATKRALFSLVDVKKRQFMLLNNREKAEVSNDILSEGTFGEGQLEESCLSHVSPSADSVNTSARSAFDLPTLDKKLKKTPGYMKFVAPSPRSKINQIKNKTVGTSLSSFPLLLKERPAGPESKVITQASFCKNVDLDDTRKNTEPGKETWHA